MMLKQKSQINSQRISERIMELSNIGKHKNGGVTRKALTKEDRLAQVLIMKWMKQAGLHVKIDNFGNVIGRKESIYSDRPAVAIGSHLDTIPNGGFFDGTIGVIGGIEVAQVIHDEGIELSHPLEVIVFSDEEGARFKGALFGSRGMVGKVKKEELYTKDTHGTNRYSALEAFGLQPDFLHQDVRKKGELKVFLEMHIEQGPYLESQNKPVGIVVGLAGPVWLTVEVQGDSGHAGTVPMSLRRDPMAGAAEMILNIETLCFGEDTPIVGTVGAIKAKPGVANVIPESIEFTVDIRDIDSDSRAEKIEEIKEMVIKVCKKRGLTSEIREHLHEDPIDCAEHVIDTMEKAGANLKLSPPLMISGAAHDAMVMSEITDIGLLFVRCYDGGGHNEHEWAEIADITKGVALLLETTLAYL